MDNQNITTTGNPKKKKFGSGKVIPTILGLVILVEAVIAGVIVTQQQRLFQLRAATPPVDCVTPTNPCAAGHDHVDCRKWVCPNGDTNGDGKCQFPDTGASYTDYTDCSSVSCGSQCCQIDWLNSPGGGYCTQSHNCKQIKLDCSGGPPPPPSCACTPQGPQKSGATSTTNSISLSWHYHGGNQEQVCPELRWRVHGSASPWNKVQLTHKTSYTITGLSPATEYDIYIKSYKTVTGSVCTNSTATCDFGSTTCSVDSANPLWTITTSNPPTLPINGSCSATHYGCSAGTSANQVDGTTSPWKWTWDCVGSGGGSTANCSENKPVCQVTTSPTVLNLNGVGKTGTVTANVTSGLAGETITIMHFGSYNTSIATVNTFSTTSPPYFTTVTAVAGGSTGVWGTATLSDNRTCTGSTTVNINGAWWQVKDGDVTTKGNLESSVPSSNYFEMPGLGGYPGIPAYGGSTNLPTNTTTANISQDSTGHSVNWIANASSSFAKIYDSNYFLGAIPAGTVINSFSNPAPDLAALTIGGVDPATGYYWNEYDASSGGTNLTIGSLNIGTKKIILISKGAEVKLTGNINLTKGQGFFMLVAGKDATGNNGDIIVDPGVGGGGSANLVGIYISDGQFKTGTNNPAVDLQLWVRGTIAAYGGMVLQRDLGSADATTPSEFFEYAPDQEILFPQVFATHGTNWQEVAP